MARKIPRQKKRSKIAAQSARRAKEQPSHEEVAAADTHTSVGLQQSVPVVGVGPSAGGLDAFTALLTHLPSDPGMAFVLIQHLDPNQPGQLTGLLSKTTSMPVLEVSADTPVEINHVYVIAPGVDLSISDGRLRAEARGSGRKLPIDSFLKSLAREKTSNSVGIVLSGTASDG